MDVSMEGASKKVPLENLTKEELIIKCKSFLSIAQKAKQSKDILIEENRQLKENMKLQENCKPQENQLKIDPQTEAIIGTLTKQKLDLLTSLEELKSEKVFIEGKYSDLDTENQGLKRQVGRLSEENESLIGQLDGLENQIGFLKKIGLEQQEQLLALEKNNISNGFELEENIKQKEKTISELENSNEKLKDKLKSYHGKIVKFAGDVKKLKESKNELISSFKTYTNQVQDWKDLLNVVLKKIETNYVESERIKTENDSLKIEIEKLQKSNSDNSEKSESKFAVNKNQNNEEEMNHIKSIFQLPVKNDLVAENEQMSSEIVDLKNREEKLLLKIDVLKGQIADLNKTNLSNEELKVKIDELKTKEENYRLEIEELRKYRTTVEEISKNIKCKKNLGEEISCLLANRDELKSINKDLIKNIEEYKILIERYLKDIDKCSNEKDDLTKKVKSYENLAETTSTEIINLKATNVDLSNKSKKYEELQRLNENLQKKIEELSKQIQKKDCEEQQMAEQTSEEIIKHVKRNQQLDQYIKNLKEQMDAIKNNSKSNEEKIIQTETQEEDKLSSLKRENAELLSEMNVMNQALKERGEVISKQQSYCDEILKKMQLFEAQNLANVETLMRKEKTIETLQKEVLSLKNENETFASSFTDEEIVKKNSEISRLKSEIIELKEKMSSHFVESSEFNYPDSETTSTVSVTKTEESSRMKDIEGSWEERYGKLRNLAIKLKAKIRQLSEEIMKEQSEKSDLSQKLIKTKQSYQQQIDLLQDQLETSWKECKTSAKELETTSIQVSNDKKMLKENEEMIKKLKLTIDNLESEKRNVDEWKKQIAGKVQTLKKELETNQMIKKEYEAQINKLNLDLEAKDRALKQEIEKHNELKTEKKKQSVLNLEIQDYEKSVKDLTQKIEKKQEIITKLKQQIDHQKLNIEELEKLSKNADENIKILDEKLSREIQNNENNKKKIVELETILNEKETKIQQLTFSVENIRMDNEDLSTQLSKTIVENEKNQTILQKQCESYKQKYLSLENSLKSIQNQFELKQNELIEIQSDYENYKVRAQSVLLRQNQNSSRDACGVVEEKLKEESASLQAQVDILGVELQRSKEVCESLSKENSELGTKNRNMVERLEKVEMELDMTAKELENLGLKHQRMIVEHTETVRGLKINSDTLAQCYRKQLSDQEDRHHREILDLQLQIDRGLSTNMSLEMISTSTPVMPPREEGEGSESVESLLGNTSKPISLEKLLSNENEQETYSIKKQLNENEAKVNHLTALLSDTEQDLAKHVQMNQVLKEEIRRQRRSLEREEHAENLEYLKNVIFKFITLGQGDERERLIPVLNTILKLSPEESQKLSTVARGEKSWSTYLPIWKQ
nr:GRIP and coiled-coil domain-containing protein 2-like [Onthophagus taurus]